MLSPRCWSPKEGPTRSIDGKPWEKAGESIERQTSDCCDGWGCPLGDNGLFSSSKSSSKCATLFPSRWRDNERAWKVKKKKKKRCHSFRLYLLLTSGRNFRCPSAQSKELKCVHVAVIFTIISFHFFFLRSIHFPSISHTNPFFFPGGCRTQLKTSGLDH